MRLARCTRWALALCALGWTATVSSAADLKLLPKDTEIVITINLKQLLASEAAKANKELVDQAKFLVENALSEKGAAKYLEKAGFDLFRDLHSITVASPASEKMEDGLILIEGNFDEDKLRAAAEDASKDNEGALKIVKSGKYQVYQVSPPNEKALYLTFASDKLMVAAASKETFDSTLARIGSGKATQLKKDMQALVDTTSPKQSLSVLATGPALARMLEKAPVPQAETAANSLQAVDAMSLAITVTRDIAFQLGVNAKDKDAAEQMAKASNGGLMLVRSMLSKKAKQDEKLVPVADVLKTLQVVSQGTNLTVRGTITFENLGLLLKHYGQKGAQ